MPALHTATLLQSAPAAPSNPVAPLPSAVFSVLVLLASFALVYGVARLVFPRLARIVAARRDVDAATTDLLNGLAHVVAITVAAVLAFSFAGFGNTTVPLLVAGAIATGYVSGRNRLTSHERPTTGDLTVALLVLVVTLLALGLLELSVGGLLVSLLAGALASVVVGAMLAVVVGGLFGGSDEPPAHPGTTPKNE